MRIKILGHEGSNFIQPKDDNPWSLFHQEFLNAGHTLMSSKMNDRYDILVANTHSNHEIELCERNQIPLSNRFLILWEPKQIRPELYLKKNILKYGTVFTPSRYWVNGDSVIDFKWPQGPSTTNFEEYDKWILRKNKSVMVASNKYSFVKGENYSLRRSVVSEKLANQIIDVAGHDWELNIKSLCLKTAKSIWRSKGKNLSIRSCTNLKPKLMNYIGSVESKSELSSHFRIALVIENSSDYISEKLFDALNSQNIVVYVGPDLKHFGLSDQMAIKVSPDLNCILLEIKKVLAMNEREQFEIVTRQQLEYKRIAWEWNNRFVLQNMAKVIIEKLKSESIM